MEALFQVKGMKCQGCVDKLEKFIGELDGVELIDVDLKNHSVKVVFDEKLTKNMIQEAILDSGFEVVG
ncbi:hypothetical protein CQA57_02820 [Helicobacter anseris]|uniref:HMA domain-containing protein n=1 Tax=Helicobacter anseris TaxID=375926 RepID=A0A3D8J9Q4_9HELI|nr:copper ion binding protein [Helicobacter anseris]RDU74217.1 hypothetical protein CQA57_02820 [Helicobacter anseris]